MTKRRRTKRDSRGARAAKIAIVTLISLTVAIVGLLGYGAYRYYQMMDNITVEPPSESDANLNVDANQGEEEAEQAKKSLKPMTVLLMGVDSRGESHARSDTIMLATIHPQTEEVLLFSVPRDTYAFVEGVGYTKFNHSMFYGGPQLVKKTMERFFDIEVDHYVTIDFEGFRRVVDELGGIEIDVERRMKYYDPADGTEIDLQPGRQVLNGEEALDYARFRLSSTGQASTDFERIERQHKVIRKIIDKGNRIRNVFKIFSFMDIVGDHVKTSLSKKEIEALARVFHDFSSERLKTVDVNGFGDRRQAEGFELWVYVVPKEERERIKGMVEQVLEGKSISSLSEEEN